MDLSLLSYGAKTANMEPIQSPATARVEEQKATRLFGESEAEVEVDEAEAVVMDPSVVAVGARYRECMRNHAASIGGLASDGCGEFMPSGGEKGEAPLSCAACGCHRSFHRREPDARERVHHNRRRHRVVHSPPHPSILLYGPGPIAPGWDQSNKLVLPQHVSAPAPLQAHVSTSNHHHRHAIQHQQSRVNVSGGAISAVDPAEDGRSETPEREEVGSEMRISSSATTTTTTTGANKRFRTKFTAEQKERMAEYAEKAGWRIHRQDDAALSAFCAEIGVKRNVLKVWMHNNKAAAASAALRRTETPATAPPPPPPAVSAPPPPPQHAGV